VTLHINVTGALYKNYNYSTLSVSAANGIVLTSRRNDCNVIIIQLKQAFGIQASFAVNRVEFSGSLAE